VAAFLSFPIPGIISSAEAFKRALLDAKSIACSGEGGGGIYDACRI
jgi:hypothetical protein